MLSGEPIIVLGVFRSGTSCLSTALSKLGVYLGAEEDFYPPNANNLGGYYEIKQFQELNLRGFATFGLNFYQADRLPTEWRSVPGAKTYMEEVRALLRGKFSGQSLWGWKEPAVTGLIPIYRDILSGENLQPRFAICVRHPLNVAGSQIARQRKWGLHAEKGDIAGLNPPIGEQTLGLWLHYTLSALRETRGCPRQVFSYEGVLAHPEQSIRRLATSMVSQPLSEGQIQDAIKSVNPEWSHNAANSEELDRWPSLVKRVYDCCLRIDQDGDGFNAGAYDDEIDSYCQEFEVFGKMIKPIRMPAGQLLVSWRHGDKPAASATKYTPGSTWQTIRVPVNIQAGAVVQIDPYQMPCQIWIRSAQWKGPGGIKRAQVSPGPSGIIEDLYGVKRLTIFGPGSLMSQTPPGPPSTEFEIEFFVQAGQTLMSNIVGMLRSGIEQTRRGGMRQPLR